MLLSQVLDSLTRRDDVWSVSVPDDWLQGRSLFGGLQSALTLRAMRGLVPADLPLRVLQTTFVAPVAGAVNIHARVLRAGKGTTHAEARMVEGDQTTTLVVGVFGRGRPSRAEVAPTVAGLGDVHDPFVFPFVPGLSAAFAQHFKMRVLSGPLPFTASSLPPRGVLEVTLDDRGATSEAHVVAIADAIPPLAFAMLTAPAPGSSVTWTLELLVDRFDTLPLAGWTVHAEVRAGHNGYTSQFSTIVAPGGQPVAMSHQSMVVFG
jgi:Thioesterase-like superfamily